MMQRLLVCACMGVTMEVCFTGLKRVIYERDWNATGTTYLWMIPAYGLGGLAAFWLRANLAVWCFVPVAVFGVYLGEYLTGWLLWRFIGRCPWRYDTGWTDSRGFIRLDYAPLWGLASLGYFYFAP